MAIPFLEKIAAGLEESIGDTGYVDLPKSFFDDKLLPYINGEKEHISIWSKVAELSNDGTFDIRLIGDDGEVATTLPAIFPNKISASDSFEDDMHKLSKKDSLLAGSGSVHIPDIMDRHLNLRSGGAWYKYIKESKAGNVEQDNRIDDDDDFELVY